MCSIAPHSAFTFSSWVNPAYDESIKFYCRYSVVNSLPNGTGKNALPAIFPSTSRCSVRFPHTTRLHHPRFAECVGLVTHGRREPRKVEKKHPNFQLLQAFVWFQSFCPTGYIHNGKMLFPKITHRRVRTFLGKWLLHSMPGSPSGYFDSKTLPRTWTRTPSCHCPVFWSISYSGRGIISSYRVQCQFLENLVRSQTGKHFVCCCLYLVELSQLNMFVGLRRDLPSARSLRKRLWTLHNWLCCQETCPPEIMPCPTAFYLIFW